MMSRAVKGFLTGLLLVTGATFAILYGQDTRTDGIGFCSLLGFAFASLLAVCVIKQNYRTLLYGIYSILTLVCLYMVLSSHYTLAIPRFMQQCLSSWNIGVIDLYDRIPERNAIYAFKVRNTGLPQRPDGTLFAKRFRGMPLDEIEVNYNTVFINGKAVARGFIHAPKLHKNAADFERHEILPPGKYLGFGDTYDSFDSRYFGQIDETQIIGRLRILF